MAGMTVEEIWDARAMAVATMDALVRFELPSEDGGWTPEDGLVVGEPVALWEGPARVQAITSRQSGTTDVAGQIITTRPYKVSTPWDSPTIPAGGWVIILEHETDPAAVGLRLPARAVVFGDLGIEQTTYCDLDLTNQYREVAP